MVATVGSISIDLNTNAAKFASGFKGAATTVERESSRMAKAIASIEASTRIVATGVKAFAGGIIAQLGLDSIRSAIDRTRAAIGRFDEVLTNARATGLATDTYQSLGLAAKKANIDQDTLNSSLLIFAKNVGLAKQGTGALFAGLAKLNPELLRNIINAKDQEERLKAVADALKNARDETERAAISAAVFGKSGVVLSRLFEDGAASINKFKQAAANLGVIVSEDDLQRAAELDDRLDDLATVINTKLDIALVKLGPALIVAANGFDILIDKATKAPDQIGAALDFLSGVTDKIEQAISSADTGDKLREQIAAVEAQIVEAKATVADFQEKLKEGFPVETDIEKAKGHLEFLLAKGAELRAELEKKIEINVDTEKAKDALAAFRRSEIEGFDLGNAGKLPTVTGSNLRSNRAPSFTTTTTPTGNTIGVTSFSSQSDKEIIAELKRQTSQDDTNASDITGATTQSGDDVSGAVDSLDSHVGGYFDGLGSRFDKSISSLGSSLSSGSNSGGSSPSSGSNSGGGLSSGGGDYVTGKAANSFKFSGIGIRNSWDGKTLTFSGGGGSSIENMSPLARMYSLNPLAGRYSLNPSAMGNSDGMVSNISDTATASSQPILVNITVKPVMEGTRLSSSSRAEIQQAASAGANAALRAYNGR